VPLAEGIGQLRRNAAIDLAMPTRPVTSIFINLSQKKAPRGGTVPFPASTARGNNSHHTLREQANDKGADGRWW